MGKINPQPCPILNKLFIELEMTGMVQMRASTQDNVVLSPFPPPPTMLDGPHDWVGVEVVGSLQPILHSLGQEHSP